MEDKDNHMDLQHYEDWSLGLHERLVSRRVPINGTIELTRRCPQRCVHCYNNLPMDDPQALRTELTYDEHCRILDEITDAGCLWLLYTGGEIFARRDFLPIYTYAKEKGLLITLFTNGTLITPEIADHLAQWRPFSIEMTIYGHTRETFERITRIPGSFDRCMQGIQLLMERKLPLKLKTMALTMNKHEIWAMKGFAEENLGLEFKFDPIINPRMDCSLIPLTVRLSPKEVVELDLKDPKRIEAWKSFAGRFNGPIQSGDHMNEVYHCGGGINAFAIDPYGMLNICVLSRNTPYNLRSGGFLEGWEGFLLEVRQKKITRQTKCISCGIKAMCGMCPANGELECMDAEAPVDFLCQVAHLRAYILDLPIPSHGECEYCKGGRQYKPMMNMVEELRGAYQ